MQWTFAYPWILYLLWSLPLWAALLHFLRKRRREKLTRFSGTTLAPRLLPPDAPLPVRLQWAATLLALTLLLIAAAGPRSTERREQEVAVRGRDLVLLLDVSRSMLAPDVHPSRLVRAKADTLDILDALRPGDRVSLVAFRNRATRITPFTTDQRFLRQAITSLSIHSAPPGPTDIAQAIQTAVNLFDGESPAHKAVIMISDGEDLSGEAIAAAQTAGAKRIPFFTVGIGSLAGIALPDPSRPGNRLQHEGETVVSRLQEEPLVTLARLSGGAYIPVGTAAVGAITLGQRIREQLRAVETQAYATIESGDHTELFAYFLLPAILLLLLVGGLSQGQLRIGRRAILAGWLLLAWMPPLQTARAAAPVSDRSHQEIARDAQALHREGNYSEAVARYQEAADHPDTPATTRDRYRYNAAIAALQAGDDQTAEQMLAGLPRLHQADLAHALALFRSGEQAVDGSPEGYQRRLEQWQEAARRLQQAPGEPDAAQDLLTLDGLLPAARQDARRARILEEYAEKDPTALVWEMLQDQRRQQDEVEQSPPAPIGPERLQQFEEWARQRQDLADQYLALSHQLQSAGLPADQLQALEQQQDEIARQIESLEDLLPPEDTRPVETGHPLYQTWRNIGAPETLLAESLRQQQWLLDLANDATNRPPPVSPEELQTEAAGLTDLFADRFQPPPDTEPETLEQIHALASEAGRLQRLAAEMLALPDASGAAEVQQEAVEALRKLSDLLPHPPPESSPQQNDQQEQDQQEQQPESAEGEQDENPPDDPGNKAPPPPEPGDGQDQQESGDEEPPEQTEDTFDLDAMLEQVEQRAREHEERQQERRQRLRSPGDRDW